MKITHFGACLGLAGDRLIRLGWATAASPNHFSAFWFSGIVFSAFGGLPRHSFFDFYNCKEHGFSLNGKRS